MDLLNTENADPTEVDIASIEDCLFTHPDTYNLERPDRVDEDLQILVNVTCSSTCFDVANYVKLDNTRLKALMDTHHQS
jgi:hypothetical protein